MSIGVRLTVGQVKSMVKSYLSKPRVNITLIELKFHAFVGEEIANLMVTLVL